MNITEARERTKAGNGRNHSTNQRRVKTILEGENRMSNEHRTKEHEKFMARLPRVQFRRCLKHVNNGQATSEEIDYLNKHMSEHPDLGPFPTIFKKNYS